MDHILELHEFFVEGGDPQRSHVLLHITEPSTPEEQEKGYFFALAEIVGGDTEQIEHLQMIIDALESGYYETEESEDRDAFELTVEYVNRRGHHVLTRNDAAITCLAGVIRGHKLSFTYHGAPEMHLLYQGKTKEGSINLCEEYVHDKSQLFSSITQGSLNNGDYIYAATPHTAEYLSTDRIQKIIRNRPTRHSAEHIEKIIKDLKNGISFGGLILHILKKEDKKMDVAEAALPKQSAAQITNSRPRVTTKAQPRAKEEQMERIPEKKKRREEPAAHRIRPETNHRTRKPPSPSVSHQVLVTVGRTLVGSLIGLGRFLQKFFLFLGKIFIGIILLISNRGGQRETVLNEMREAVQKRKNWIAELPLLSKLLFALTLIFATIFIASIGIIRVRENQQAVKQQYVSSVEAIKNKKDAAEASLIYNDREKALLMLQEAKILLAGLPDNSSERKQTKQELEASIESVLLSLRNMVMVTPEVKIDLSTLQEGVDTQNLALLGDDIIAYGSNDNTLYLFDRVTNNVEQKEYSDAIHLEQHSTPKEDDQIVFTTRDQGIAVYTKESEVVSTKDITHTNEQTALASLFVYNQRLYGLDVTNNQLFKYNPTQTGYDKGAPWIKEDGVDISDGTSLAIDGDIFIMKMNGQILKLSKGKSEPFTVNGLDPQLDAPRIIWTYNDVNNIYILEPTNRRVVVLDKTGRLIKQYTANEWQNPTGMVVDEAKNAVYILDNNKIYQFSL